MSQSLATKTKDQIKQLRERAEKCTLRNDREGYDLFWGDDELVELYLEPARIASYRMVAELCAHWGGSVIDMGCGSGTMLQELLRADKTGAKAVTGVDYAPASIARCKRLIPAGTFFQRDLCDTELPGASFDLVLSMQTMEHLDRPKEAFEEMWRLMKPGARLVITIPNGETDTWEGHHNFWTMHSFLELAARPAETAEFFNERRNLLFVFRRQ